MKKTVLVVLALALMGFAAAAGCVTTPADNSASSPVGVWHLPGASEVVLYISPDGTYFGHAQVNSFSGTYTVDGDKLTFDAPAATLMDGPGIEEETAFFQALSAVKTFSSADSKLVLSDGEEPVLILVESLVGTWEGDNGMSVTFNSDLTFGGRGPVNGFGGTYAYDAERLVITPEYISDAVGSDEEMEAEAAFINALASAKDYSVSGKLVLYDAEYPKTGNVLLTFTASPVGSYMNQYGDTLVLYADSTFTGQAPVNTIKGTYEIADGKLVLHNFTISNTAGDEESMLHEAAFLEKLEAENYTFELGPFLTGYSESGEILHIFYSV